MWKTYFKKLIVCIIYMYISIKLSEKFNCKKSVRSVRYQKNFKSKIFKFLVQPSHNIKDYSIKKLQ